MAEPEIREGFLCPMCMKDLGGVADLQDHFEVAHSNEDKAVLQQLKGKIFVTILHAHQTQKKKTTLVSHKQGPVHLYCYRYILTRGLLHNQCRSVFSRNCYISVAYRKRS